MIEMRSLKITLPVILPLIISHTILHSGSIYFCLLAAAGAFHDFDVGIYALSSLVTTCRQKQWSAGDKSLRTARETWGVLIDDKKATPKFSKMIYFRRFTPFFLFCLFIYLFIYFRVLQEQKFSITYFLWISGYSGGSLRGYYLFHFLTFSVSSQWGI